MTKATTAAPLFHFCKVLLLVLTTSEIFTVSATISAAEPTDVRSSSSDLSSLESIPKDRSYLRRTPNANGPSGDSKFIMSRRSSQQQQQQPTRMLSPMPQYDRTTPPINFQLFVNTLIGDAMLTGSNEITIPSGYYRVEPPNPNAKSHLTLSNLNDFTIHADNVHMVCTKTTRAITINKCSGLTIRGMTIDYDPLPFTQGNITAINGLELTIDLLSTDSDTTVGYNDANMINFNKNDKIEIYSLATMELSAPTYYNVNFQKISDTTIKAIKPNGSGTHESIGDIAVIKTKNLDGVAEHAIRAMECTNLVMDSVKLYGSTMFGFFETDCSSSVYRNCAVDRRAPENDLYSRPVPRMRSITADGFHSKHAIVGPTYDGIIARYNGDDGVAINGHYHLIMSSAANVLRVIGKFDEKPNIEVGDSVEIVSPGGMRMDDDASMGGQVIVTAIRQADPDDLVTAEERTWLVDQSWQPNVGPKARSATNIWYITISKDLPEMAMGGLIASSNRIGNNYKVINSIIGPLRSRGILVKASQGLIMGNRLIDTWGHAIMAAPEFTWLEAGSGSNIRIQDNFIAHCRDVAIAVYAKGSDDSWAPAGAHKNIVIAGNTIEDSAYPNVALSGIMTLDYYGNSLGEPNNHLLRPKNLRKFGRNNYEGAAATRKLFTMFVEDIVWNKSRDTIDVTPQKLQVETPEASTPSPQEPTSRNSIDVTSQKLEATDSESSNPPPSSSAAKSTTSKIFTASISILLMMSFPIL